MAFVIGSACIDTTDKSCIEVCPVDCIYEGDRMVYINPGECIDCGACETACPMSAIFSDQQLLDPDDREFEAYNAGFFTETLRGQTAPLGTPGGAGAVGRVGVDLPPVAAFAGS
jgi:NAD-dependent dihydropyrimidine dehydrogenase PreA subunit